MKTTEFGKDPMDRYSVPVETKSTKLGIILTLPLREKKEKPGRSLAVVWDERVPQVEGFANKYQYVVRFSEKGNHAGNHYHFHKEELFYPVNGSFLIILENIHTKEREEIELDSSDNQMLNVKPEVAHVVVAQSNPATLLVFATYPNNEEDEFSYKLR